MTKQLPPEVRQAVLEQFKKDWHLSLYDWGEEELEKTHYADAWEAWLRCAEWMHEYATREALEQMAKKFDEWADSENTPLNETAILNKVVRTLRALANSSGDK